MAELQIDDGRGWPKSELSPTLKRDSESELDLRPIRWEPEPVGELHPKLNWFKKKKVRSAWIGDDLFEKFPGTDKTKAQVLVEAGFNMVSVSMPVSMGDDGKNRSVSSDLANRLADNVKEARRAGITFLVKWLYGSLHQEPYRKYRSPGGQLASRSSCPLDEQYIERHIGRWALASARGGADGFLIDTEMYGSDQTNYPGPCMCDNCFRVYLDTFSSNPQSLYDQVEPEKRGLWLSAKKATEHYALYAAKRIEEQYDGIRARCQAINPAFMFAHAPLLGHVPGIEEGLGTSTVPCLVFSEREYTKGPASQSFANVERVRRKGAPVLYLCGAFTTVQTPEMVEDHALISSLYCDGWWLYYASAVLNYPGTDDPKAYNPTYGRVKGTSAWDYLDRIRSVHARVDQLLKKPKEQWPKPKELPPTPSADVPRRKGTINIDGKLDESAWKQASKLDVTLDLMGEKAGPPTRFLLCWDEEALYVAARCEFPKGAKLNAPARGCDNGTIWQFDGVEIFLDPGASGTRYVQFMVSALGDICDVMANVEIEGDTHGNPGWNTDTQVAATNNAEGYLLEMRIPFRDFASPPKAGDVWAANFYRFRPAGLAWSPTYAGFHTPSRFGTITFVDGLVK